VIIRGYIDESYDSDIFTLSCAMSDVKGWQGIESAWKKCLVAKNKELKKAGRQQISRYHAADCSSLVNEFAGWSVPEQIAFSKELMAIFNRGKNWINVIAYSMPLAAFKAEFPECSDDPLPACYSLLKMIMLEIADQFAAGKKKYGKIKPVDVFLFYERCSYGGVLLNSFNHAKDDQTFAEREQFRTIAPLSWETCTALQPADLIAYETFKDAQRAFSGRIRRKSLEFLLSTDTFGGRARTFKPDAFKILRQLIDEGKRQRMNSALVNKAGI